MLLAAAVIVGVPMELVVLKGLEIPAPTNTGEEISDSDQNNAEGQKAASTDKN